MDYLIHLTILFAIYAILALSLNLVVGYTGLVSVTHAGFFAVGAYATGLLTTKAHTNFFLALIISAVLSMVSAWLVGYVLSRFRDDFYVLGSVGFGIIVYSIALNWQTLTDGPLGIAGIPRPSLFNINFFVNFNFLVLVALLLIIIYWLCKKIVDSSFGRALKGIREDEQALSVFGYKTLNYKLLVFIISAGFAAIAGSLFASYITYIDPTTFTSNESIFILSTVILGGLANLRGSLLGALILILLPEALRFVGFPDNIAAQMRLVIYGLMLVILMLYRPQGLIGEYKL